MSVGLSIRDAYTYTHNMHRLNRHEKIDLALFGVRPADFVQTSKTAYVLGVHFKAGEWNNHVLSEGYRCGSVITTTYTGKSRYCVVTKFIRVSGRDFACVRWLTKPVYPYAPNPLVVKVREARVRSTRLPTVLPLDFIDPTAVLVEPDADNVHFYMMRLKGFDRTRGCPRLTLERT